jgi:uncharacterized membrane protein
LIFAVASPIGLLFGEYLNSDFKVYFLALVGGIFLHISSVIIFESNKNHSINRTKILLVISGVILAMAGHFWN